MDTLGKQVRRAQRRLMVRGFARSLPWCLCVALFVAAVLVGIDKFVPLGVATWQWPAGALLVGLISAAVWAVLVRRNALDAAVEIDRRFGLRERVSSTLSLGETELETPAGRALVADAVKRVERVHVAERFELWGWSWSWASLAVPAAAFALALMLSPSAVDNPAQGDETVLSRAEIKKEAKTLRQQLIERRKEARDKGLAEAEQLFQKLEQGAKQIANDDQTSKKQALVELNDLAKELEKRRDALGGSEKIKDQLNNLKDIQQGPADKFAQALKDGDFQKAMNEIKNLRDQLNNNNLDAQARQKLADQMEAIESKLKNMADAHKRAMDDLKKQIERKKQSGDEEAARKLQDQLNQMAQQTGQMNQMNDLAQKLGQCAECLKQGQSQQAMQGLQDLEGQLGELQQQLDEMEMLDDAMAQLGECKNCLNGSMARGRGNNPGQGLGEGRGFGQRPLERTNSGTFNSRVRQKVGPGSATITEFVDGQNIKGDVQQQIKDEVESSRAEASDPLTDQPLPRGVKDHAREYFSKLREGQ